MTSEIKSSLVGATLNNFITLSNKGPGLGFIQGNDLYGIPDGDSISFIYIYYFKKIDLEFSIGQVFLV